MENSEEFERMVTSINQLEQQLLSIQEDALVNEKYGVEAEEEIESYFARCEQALAARKVTLLRELAEQIKSQKKAAADAQEEVNKAIKARKKILKAGSYVYVGNIEAAEQVWKGASNLKGPQISVGMIQVVLSSSSLEMIQALGKVVLDNKQTPAGILETRLSKCDYSIAKQITTLAGSVEGFVDGDGGMAKFDGPSGICWNSHDNCLYLCDFENNAIRRITLQGQVKTLARGGLLSGPVGIAMHYGTNTLFVTNSKSHSICKIAASGLVSLHAGCGQAGNCDGLGATARFEIPNGIAINQRTDTIYVCDCTSVRKITLQGEVSTLAGSADEGDVDGKGGSARFKRPSGICFDEKHQSILVGDCRNHKVKRVSLEGDVSTVCIIEGPKDVLIANNIILVTAYGGKIFRVTEAGEVSVLRQRAEGKETKKCKFIVASGAALDETSNTCFVVDYGEHVIKSITF